MKQHRQKEAPLFVRRILHTNKFQHTKCTLTPVGATPQVSDNLVDLIHLHAVELHDRSRENRKETKSWTTHPLWNDKKRGSFIES